MIFTYIDNIFIAIVIYIVIGCILFLIHPVACNIISIIILYDIYTITQYKCNLDINLLKDLELYNINI